LDDVDLEIPGKKFWRN